MLTQKGIKSILDRHVRLNQFLDGKKYILGSIVLIGLFIVFMFNSFAALEPVSSVTIKSTTLDYTKSEEGSWQYTKTAKWISKGKARIDINLETLEKSQTDYTDVILVLDTSGSMLGEKLSQLQTDVNEFINDTIPKGNKISIISFNSDASVLTSFTNDNSLLQDSINNLTAAGETNYYQALVKVDDVLSTYSKESNRDCVVLFLTDGLPTIDTPNEITQYNHLKNKYSYLKINGIQYELGEELLNGIKNITDTQFIASTENLNEFLYKASISASNYENFILTDYIDENYFTLKDVENIDTTFGEVTISDNKIIWNLNNLKSGLDASMTFYINLNDNLIGVGGVYSTSTKTDVSYKINSSSYNESSTKTPVLSDNYSVTYDANAPTGCVVSNVPTTKNYSVFDTVKIESTIPTCENYQFKKWEIVTENVNRSGDNYFFMPESNVTIKAIWKKSNLVKSMDGKISKVQTLYKLIASNSKGIDTSISFRNSPNSTNSGIYTRSGTESNTYPVYYYRGIINNNNIVFAGFCWKIVRTTEPGGVKLIYNGVYDSTNKCSNTGATYVGTSAFNTTSSSPADIGYMYGTRYRYNDYSPTTTANVLTNTTINSSSNYYYGTSITYSNGTYTLQNAVQKVWSDNYTNLVGYYTCNKTTTTCSNAYYIAGSNSTHQYNVLFSNGETVLANQVIVLGKSVIDNGNNTYTLNETVTIQKKDWYNNHNSYNNYYICRDLTSTTCTNKNYITTSSNYAVTYDNTFDYIYGNDVSWDGSQYTLVDTITSKNTWNTDKTTLAKRYHYTCLNTTGKCTSVYYVHMFGNSSLIYYLTLTNGKNIETTKDEMFQNKNSSAVKKVVDTWYQNNLTSYTSMLEDTIWCNDRTFYSGALVSKDTDALTDASYISVNNRVYNTYNPSVTCPNATRDGFTVSTSSGGNGALTYPIGLLTADEIRLVGGYDNLHYLSDNQYWWTMSPYYFFGSNGRSFRVNSSGVLNTQYIHTASPNVVRPSVSLVKGTRISDGDGTANNPFVIGDE